MLLGFGCHCTGWQQHDQDSNDLLVYQNPAGEVEFCDLYRGNFV